jgi:hypothetical protein
MRQNFSLIDVGSRNPHRNAQRHAHRCAPLGVAADQQLAAIDPHKRVSNRRHRIADGEAV